MLKNVKQTKIFNSFMLNNIIYQYLCTVFFMVLD